MDNSLKLKKYINNKTSFLERFIRVNDKISLSLMNEFLSKVLDCDCMGDVDELFEQIYPKMKKNALSFLLRSNFQEYCGSYKDEKLDVIIEQTVKQMVQLDFEADFDKCQQLYDSALEKIGDRIFVLKYYSDLVLMIPSQFNFIRDEIDISRVLECSSSGEAKIVFDEIKDKIIDRCDYAKRVAAKINGFLNYYKNGPRSEWYSYTVPFIEKLVDKYRGYYDITDKTLSGLEDELKSLKFVIEKQKNLDIYSAIKKKTEILRRFEEDFNAGVFVINDKFDSRNKLFARLRDVVTYGGFADFDNKFIKSELSNSINYIGIYLKNSKDTLSKDKQAYEIVGYINKAIILWNQLRNILDSVKDFSKIEVSDSVWVDYKKFGIALNTLGNIDFLNDTIEDIVSKISYVDEFLNAEEYDRQTMEIFNKKKNSSRK